MNVNVRLQDENGHPQNQNDIGIDFELPIGNGSFRLLCYIDPYGDTIFNRSQMDAFLEDWERVKTCGPDEGSVGSLVRGEESGEKM
jgi:hypothetical protein